MKNKTKVRHLVQSAQFHANEVEADVEQDHDRAHRPIDTTSPPASAGGYPFAPPFMLPQYHKRLHGRAQHPAQPLPLAPPASADALDRTVTIFVVRIEDRRTR